MIEQMAKPQKDDAQHGESNLNPAMRKRQRARHQANANRADRCGQEQPMIAETLAQRQSAEQNGKQQSDLMENWIKQDAACRCKNGQQQSRCKAMQKAQSGDA
jgi:hypothetical protein